LILQEKFFRLCTGFFALLDIDEKLRMRNITKKFLHHVALKQGLPLRVVG